MSENEFIIGCQNQDSKIQNLVYKTYAPKVFGICKRYMKDRERAEEMVMNTFLAVFQKTNQFKNQGSFEGWILRIAVNSCLMELRKKTNFENECSIDHFQFSIENEVLGNLDENDIEKMLQLLPEGARIIFNLYVMEGYKHSEIAEKLNIAEGTSKSQLNYAKEKLKKIATVFNQSKIKEYGR
ncbi:RNA polymerase sigma-70 factor (ECF subfamily) [Flavobacterium arsenatis]|uniref:RNA polymerase sigma-70 factor (ECF subfamily) n=1 Tax=Flavobacterium arsenatis TaxID=1484332 RepID=A0ABU1TTN9_9FLAO|nr:sigma-70 family RNA polymerase sigma factor [Flavobacterium arsenatis]MDR6969233.1 RNA polymerase sigma-70 factor (ECF subfamily) [Flavobacterium arsenatis]